MRYWTPQWLPDERGNETKWHTFDNRNAYQAGSVRQQAITCV